MRTPHILPRISRRPAGEPDGSPKHRTYATSTDRRHGRSPAATPAPAPRRPVEGGAAGITADVLSAAGGFPRPKGRCPRLPSTTDSHRREAVRRPRGAAVSNVVVIAGDRSLIVVLPAVLLLLERPDRDPVVVVPGVHVLRGRLRHGRRVGDRSGTAGRDSAVRIRRTARAGAAGGVAGTRLAGDHVAADGGRRVRPGDRVPGRVQCAVRVAAATGRATLARARRRRGRRIGGLGRREAPVRVATAVRRRARRLGRGVGHRPGRAAGGGLPEAVAATVSTAAGVATDRVRVATGARVRRAGRPACTTGCTGGPAAAGTAGRVGRGRRARAARSAGPGCAGARATIAGDAQAATVAARARATGARAAGAGRAGRRARSAGPAGPTGPGRGCRPTGAAVARVGRGVTTAAGVGVAAVAARATVGRLASAGLDAAEVRSAAARGRVVALVVGVARGGEPAVGVLVDVACGDVAVVDDRLGLVVVRDRAAVVADGAGVAARDPPPA